MLLAVSKATGRNCECIPDIAIALAGGMGAGEVCGAVAGGVLAIGLTYGEEYPEAVGVLTEEYMTKVTELEGSVRCTDIIGTDISGAMGADSFRSIARIMWVFFVLGRKKNCKRVVRSTVQVLLEQYEEWEK